MDRMLPDMADFLLGLDAEQLAALEKNLATANAKLAREMLKGTREERRLRRTKKFIDACEDYLGDLSPAQEAIVVARVAAIPEPGGDWLADRRARQQEVVRLIRDKGSREQTMAGLRRVVIDMDGSRRPEYVAMLRQREAQVFAMTASLSETLTVEQRARLQKKIRGYLSDVAYLMLPG
jgi:hypothetical protein